VIQHNDEISNLFIILLIIF